MIRSVLIANRGEIACRVARTCRKLGLGTVAVYSDADRRAPHVLAADRAIRLGPGPARQSYLDMDAVLAALRQSGADALHPGYGMLSEAPEFAEAVTHAGAIFIGPSADVLARVGDKTQARELAARAGVPLLPGSGKDVSLDGIEHSLVEASAVGFPLLVKPAAGGGGIGVELVCTPADLEPALRVARDRARAAFGDDRVYFERYLPSPRHVEVQIACDGDGVGSVLGERECSVQRRHQKVVEESPSPAHCFVGEEGARRRTELFSHALHLLSEVGYRGLGTVEFLVDGDDRFYFLEVNPRLQVEHPLTELRTGLDLVELQIGIAQGDPLPEAARRPTFIGHAVEARVYAEDPNRGYLPQPGCVTRAVWPQIEGVRVDSGVEVGSEVSAHYDPLIAKLIAHGEERIAAIERLTRAIEATELVLVGPKGPRATNLELLATVLRHKAFTSGDYNTRLLVELDQARSSGG